MRGAVNAEVQLQLPGHRTLVATATLESLEELGLKRGSPAGTIVKASHVPLAVPGWTADRAAAPRPRAAALRYIDLFLSPGSRP